MQSREEQHSEEGDWRWEEWKRVPGDVNSLQLTLHPYCTYSFRVIAANELGHSEPSRPSQSHETPSAGETSYRHCETISAHFSLFQSSSVHKTQIR